MVAQWTWNLRLELGHQLHPDSVRTTEFAPALPTQHEQTSARPAAAAPASGYAPPARATSWKAGRFTGSDFPLQPDGTLRCPAGNTLTPQEHRRETDGSLRVVYAASIRCCRPCPLRKPRQWNGSATKKPRQVSILLHPLRVGNAPLLWCDWSRRVHRRACLQFVRHHCVEVSVSPSPPASPITADVILSRAQRAHTRLSWETRLARNARSPAAGPVSMTLFGIPHAFARWLGLSA